MFKRVYSLLFIMVLGAMNFADPSLDMNSILQTVDLYRGFNEPFEINIDLIDFDYPHWHTLQDTPDKCSAASLEKVGRLLVALIYGE